MSLIVDIEKRLPGFALHAAFECGVETLALLGASGSGKTLTLSCIAGTVRPDSGHMELNGRVLYDSKARICLSPQERGIGLLFQSYALFPNMTVERNILCGLNRVKGRNEKTARMNRLMRQFRLEGLGKQYPHQLSGGQQQRVALARVLASEPKLLMLDEPFSALDEALKWQLEQELMDMLVGFSAPVLYITHDMREVRRLCSRACVLDSGQTQAVMTPSELFDHPATLAAARLGGCENVVIAQRRGEHIAYVPEWHVELCCAEKLRDGLCGIAVRAERIAVNGTGNLIPCKVLRAMEDLGRQVAVCRPLCCEQAQEKATVRVAWLGQKNGLCAGNEPVLAIPPEAIRPLYMEKG
ncbi:MAG: ATP-binding cassette domain-containing protein [Clostridia bacterium]